MAWGEIGRKIAARVAAFESEVGYFSRTRYELPYQYFDSLADLADWCSVLIIAVRAGPRRTTSSTPKFWRASARMAMSSISRAAPSSTSRR
jgi:lactate dehydrogenase-like 2-hydroxyacid dehydrogenase